MNKFYHTRTQLVMNKKDSQEIHIDAPEGDHNLNFVRWVSLARFYGNDYDPEVGEKVCEANAQLFIGAHDLLMAHIDNFNHIGKWLSAALDDPMVCSEMKEDIQRFFDETADAVESATGKNFHDIINMMEKYDG